MKPTHLLFVVVLVLCHSLALTQTRTINSSGDWNDSGNWSGGNIGGAVDNDDDVVQNEEDDITVKNGDNYTISSFDAAKKADLTVEAGGTLTITGDYDVGEEADVEISGSLVIQGNFDAAKKVDFDVKGSGSVSVSGTFDMGEESDLKLEGSSSMTITGNANFGKKSDVESKGTSSLTFNGAFTAGEESDIKSKETGSIELNGAVTMGKKADIKSEGSSTLTINGDIDLGEESEIESKGTGSSITITGNITAGKKFEIESKETSSITVNGNISAGEESDFESKDNGNLTLNGNLSTGKDSELKNDNSFTINGNLHTGTDTEVKGDNNIPVSGTCTGFADVCADAQIAGTLPVEMSELSARTVDNGISVTWITYSEINCDRFDVYRSTDGFNYEYLTSLSGQGNSNDVIEYKVNDEEPRAGMNYYKIIQVDFDGTEYQYTTYQFYEVETQSGILVYPNPSNGTRFFVTASENVSSQITLVDLSGRSVEIQVLQSASITEINPVKELVPGIYLLNILTPQGQISKKLLVY